MWIPFWGFVCYSSVAPMFSLEWNKKILTWPDTLTLKTDQRRWPWYGWVRLCEGDRQAQFKTEVPQQWLNNLKRLGSYVRRPVRWLLIIYTHSLSPPFEWNQKRTQTSSFHHCVSALHLSSPTKHYFHNPLLNYKNNCQTWPLIRWQGKKMEENTRNTTLVTIR